LLLSDLFGHARGAFTGADRERLGVFETAQGGTVFLDEIGDLPPVAQGMLLRVLQEGEVRRLGESLARKVDVRVVAATHRDLARASREGAFRQDLYFRLRGASVTLPPLRERGGDVILLATRMIEREASRLKIVPVPRLDAQAAERLARHSWPGNVRELENVVRVACQLAAGQAEIALEHLEIEEAEGKSAGSYQRQVDELKSRLIREALIATGRKRAAAARLLGLTRQALSYLIRELRIDDF
jgi:two-component system response regulator AtoC